MLCLRASRTLRGSKPHGYSTSNDQEQNILAIPGVRARHCRRPTPCEWSRQPRRRASGTSVIIQNLPALLPKFMNTTYLKRVESYLQQ